MGKIKNERKLISLFEIRTERYDAYFVIADGFEDAKNKVEKILIEQNVISSIDRNGNLKNQHEIDIVKEVRHLTDRLIL